MSGAPEPSLGADRQADAPRILCVHPNGELYGSDRVFLQAVRAFRERWPAARITILLPVEGALSRVLRESEPDVRVTSFNVLRRAKLGRTLGNMLRLPLDILAARREIARHDLTYISTIVVLDFILATRIAGRPAMIHLHELPVGPEAKVFRGLIQAAKARLICISGAVRDAFGWSRGRDMRVIWNGTGDLTRAVSPVPHDGTLRLLLIGRFNAWKGQPVLIDAIATLTPEERERLSVRIVGSVYEGQEHFETEIHDRIARLDLGGCVTVSPFVPDPAEHYDWADVVAVPSTKPEPFGLVAIEGMAAGRAVIAAGHGGLAEIVVDGETGALVTPGDPAALAAAIRAYLDAPDLVGRHGQAGRARFEREFRDDAFRRHIADAAEELLR